MIFSRKSYNLRGLKILILNLSQYFKTKYKLELHEK